MSNQSTQLTIRRATLADAEAIGTIHKVSWDKAYPDLLPSSVLDTRTVSAVVDKWVQNLQEESRETYVAELDGRVIGFASAGPARDADTAGLRELYALHILPDVYGSGAAKTLLDAALPANACLYLIDGNARAEAFYAKNGFSRDGTTKFEESLWGEGKGQEVRMVRRQA